MIVSIIEQYSNKVRKAVSLIALNSGKKIVIGGKRYSAKGLFFNRLSLIKKNHEEWLDAAYIAALKSKEGAFIDVGANTGQTLLKILSFDRNREYVGFEPQLDCSFFIGQFINANNLSTHTIIPIGLSNKSAILQLLKRYDITDATASTIEGFRPDEFYSAKQTIYVVKGDDVISQMSLKNIAIVKIDVEGGELEVIEGMRGVLRDHTPFVFFEVLNHYLAVTGQKLDEDTIKFRESRNNKMENILRENGYKIFNILPDNKIVEISKIQPIVSNDLKITDYVAVYSDYKDQFLQNFKGKVVSTVNL